MMNTEPLIRVTVCVKRKKGMTEEEFNKYWAYTHGPLATAWLLRCGILRYVQVCHATKLFFRSNTHKPNQYHTTSEHKVLAKKMSEAVGRPLLEYDGMGDFWVRKYEDFESAFLDEEYQEKIRPDELKLIDMDSIAVTVGVEYVAIDDGKVVESHQRNF
jgi:hypothetical protein